MRNAYHTHRHPKAAKPDKRTGGSGYIESASKMEKALQAALEQNKQRLSAQREELEKKRRLRGK